MLWFCCLPHLTGHKMSGNYIRVIPPVSTFVRKFSGEHRETRGHGPAGPGIRSIG
jgi:hypothetical protein